MNNLASVKRPSTPHLSARNADGATEQASADWMRELARHYARMRRAYPEGELCVVFDIGGTILAMRHLVVHVLLDFDRARETEYFRGLRAEDVTVHEPRVEEFLDGVALPENVRRDVLRWYAERLWHPEANASGDRGVGASTSSMRAPGARTETSEPLFTSPIVL